MAKVIKEKEMNVNAADLMAVIQDYENYPEFLPEVVGAEIVTKGKKKNTEVQFDLNLIKQFQYKLSFDEKSDTEVSWTLVDSDFFKANEGRWVLTPKNENTTLARYELEVGFGFLVPGFITKTLTETNLPGLLDRFEKRTLEVSKKKPKKSKAK